MRSTQTSARHARWILTAATATLLLGTASCLTGCEDAEANARDQASRTIDEQSRKLESAVLTSDAAKLQAVVSALSGVKGSDGQQAAASMLASGANRKLASISLMEASEYERQVGDHRSLLLAQIDTAIQFGQVLESLASIDPAEQTRALDSGRARANASLQQHSNSMAELDTPIAELRNTRAADVAQVEELRRRANDLLRQASQLSYSEGYDLYERGIEARREADKIEYRVVLTELQLNYEYEAEHNLANAQAQGDQSLIASIEESKRDLSSMHSTLGQYLREGGSQFDQLVSAIAAGVRAMQELRDGPLSDAYETATSNADMAMTKAQSAAGKIRGQADAARVAQARAAEVKGRAYAQLHRGLEQQAEVLQRLVDSADAIGGNYVSQLQATRDQMEEAKQMAIAAFMEAREAAQGVTGRDSVEAIAAFNAGLDSAITSLGGTVASMPTDG